MSDNMPGRDPFNDDPRTQVEDWMQGNGGLIAGAVIVAIALGFLYYMVKSFF